MSKIKVVPVTWRWHLSSIMAPIIREFPLGTSAPAQMVARRRIWKRVPETGVGAPGLRDGGLCRRVSDVLPAASVSA